MTALAMLNQPALQGQMAAALQNQPATIQMVQPTCITGTICTTPIISIYSTGSGAGTYTAATSGTAYSTSGTNSVVLNPSFIMDPDALIGELPSLLRLQQGMAYTVEMPDGSVIEVDAKGNYKVLDCDAKVTYLANRVREFNRYLNASDLLAEFIKYVGSLAVTREEFMKLPIEQFIQWLILEAARQDGDAPDPQAERALLEHRRKELAPRCGQCQRFIPRLSHRAGLDFCGGKCFERKRMACIPIT